MNNVSLIIGGTSGIGLDTAKYLLKKKYEVVVIGRRKIRLDLINSYQVDVRSENSIKSFSDKIASKLNITNLIYSAGVTSSKNSILNFSEKVFNDIMNTNVIGLLRVLKIFYPQIKKNKGKIVVVNSIAGRSYSKFSGLEYTISKSALSGLKLFCRIGVRVVLGNTELIKTLS